MTTTESTATRTTHRNVTCDRCGATALTWMKSAKGNWYLAERVYTRGYSGRSFRSMQPHFRTCGTLSTPAPKRADDNPHAVYGQGYTVVEDPSTHTHTWHPWKPAAGSLVYGAYCFGCNTHQID